jgi:hypothetical protein
VGRPFYLLRNDLKRAEPKQPKSPQDGPRSGIHSSQRYMELVRRAHELEELHGFRLAPDDFSTSEDLHCAMTLFTHLPSCSVPEH